MIKVIIVLRVITLGRLTLLMIILPPGARDAGAASSAPTRLASR